MNSTNSKPMTIKEYKKNYYKVHARELSEIDKDNLNQSKSILLYKILKNKQFQSYILNSSTCKTTPSLYQNEENRKKAIKIIKKKKININNTSQVSPFKNRESPTFFIGNLKDINTIKIDYSQQNKSYNNLNIYYKSAHNKNKSNENILTDSYFPKKYKDRTTNTSKKNIHSYKAITPLKNLRNKKNLNDSKDERNNENKKYDAAYKNKDNSHLFYHCKHNHSKSQKELSTIKNSKDIKYPKKNIAYLNYNIKAKKSKCIKTSNNCLTSVNTSKTKKIEKIKFLKNIKNDKYSNNNINNPNINGEKEFNNLQIKKVELFAINKITIKENESKSKKTISNAFFKYLEKEKCINFFLKNQKNKKVIYKDKDKDKKTNKYKDNYTGFILIKKKMGNIEEEIKLKDDIENTKSIFLNLLNDLSDDQLQFITSKELTSLKSEINENINIINNLEKEKSENILKSGKIKEQEEIILKKEEELFDQQVKFLKLQSEFEKLKTENDKMEEKLKSMEKESKKILEDNSKLKDEYIKYKNKKDEKMNNEIKELEGKIKKYKEELKKNNNYLKNNFNLNLGDTNSKIKRMSVTYNFKFDTLLKNLEKKKNENKNKSINTNSSLSKLVIIDEKKILEDKEEIEEIGEEKIENLKMDVESKKKDIINKLNKENNIIKDSKEINENKIQQPIINNDSSSYVNKNEIESKMINNMNNIQVIQIENNDNDIKKDINDDNKNNIKKTNDKKEKKMSKALDRFKKKMSQVQPNIPPKNYTNERSHSCAKRSEKISGIARMLEQQMGRRDEKIELKEENRAATDDETDRELDIVKLIEKKPTYGGKKRKPTLKNKFSKEPFDE